jgi:hypothetical protein
MDEILEGAREPLRALGVECSPTYYPRQAQAGPNRCSSCYAVCQLCLPAAVDIEFSHGRDPVQEQLMPLVDLIRRHLP